MSNIPQEIPDDQLFENIRSHDEKKRTASEEYLYWHSRQAVIPLIVKLSGTKEDALKLLRKVLVNLRTRVLENKVEIIKEMGWLNWVKFATENEVFHQRGLLADKVTRQLEKEIKPWIAQLPYIKDTDEVNEVFQNAMLAFLKKIDKPRQKRLSAYLIGICKNKGKDIVRKQKTSRKQKEKFVKEQENNARFELPKMDLRLGLSNNDKLKIRQLFEPIKKKCRELLRLRVLEDKSRKEVVGLTKYATVQVISNELGNCKTKLRTLLIKHPLLINHLNLLWDDENDLQDE